MASGKSAKSSGKTRAAASARTRSVAVAPAKGTAAVVEMPLRAAGVAAALGSRHKLAVLLEVSDSQPTRWISGQEAPNPRNARAIVDLDYVIARAGLLWKPEIIGAWLQGRNAYLDGARPIDVVKVHGSGPVIEALDQELAGVFA